MNTSAQAFDAFLRSLEPTEKQAAEATKQQQVMFENLRQALRPKEAILSGSYGRGTAIRPLHDIDLFLVLGSEPVPSSSPALSYLQRIQKALQDNYHGKQAKLQARSVNIEFTTTELGFDVVPALEDPHRQGVYWIPERDSGAWIPSNPRLHKQACDAANAQASGMLKPLIKLVKRWNQRHGKLLASFHLEVMAYEAFPSRPDSYANGLRRLFEFLSERVTRLCADPAGLGPAIDARLTPQRREEGKRNLAAAARKAAKALEYEEHGHLADAYPLWRALLGDDFPAR